MSGIRSGRELQDLETGIQAMTGDPDVRFLELTPVQRRRLFWSCEIQAGPTDRIAFQHTILCQTCLPYRDPGNDVRVWQREQGIASLRVEAGAARDPRTRKFIELGLPYGARPRLILMHLNSEALKHGSPRIEVEGSLTAFIRRIQEHSPTGPQVRRFKTQLSRLAASMVRLAIDFSSERAFQVDTKIIDAFELWLTKDERQRVLWPSVVELSPRYFDSLVTHAVPLDERAVGALSNSPLALDVYAWMAQRLHRINPGRPQHISWDALHDQFGCGYRHVRQFRAAFKKVLAQVCSQYPSARVQLEETGIQLGHSPPPVASRLVLVRKPLG
jgi:Plasmid encoded RepA protein